MFEEPDEETEAELQVKLDGSYEEGARAYRDGNRCPYPMDSDEESAWLSGYEHAMHEKVSKR